MTEPTIRPAPLSIPPRAKKPRRGLSFLWMALFAALASGGVLWASGVRSLPFWGHDPSSKRPTLLIDRGDIPVYVVESGALESADNATIICEVEALLGQVSSNLSSGAMSSTPTARVATAATASTTTASAGTAAAATKVGSASASSAAGTAAASATAAAAAATGGVARPTIQSFTMVIAPHVPLRGTAATAKKAVAAAPQGNGGGGGGGGGRNGGNAPTGSTRILWIAAEGTHVKPGDIVAKLDSAAFVDEQQGQMIRVVQARSWVEQAERVLDVTKIALREYEQGIFPQDQLLIDQYIESCETQVQKSRGDLAWARGVVRKGLRSDIQFKADQLTAVKTEIVLQEALGMKARLENYASHRLSINIKAKIDSVQSDLLAQRAAYKLEEDRLKRIEKMIDNCTLRAPREGIVAYANQSNGWGRVTSEIMEGATVREGQPIINLPNPNRMRVRAKINESKVTSIVPGLRTQIVADAFPDTVLPGVVTDVTAIPGPANGPISDVKVYFATVRIDGGKVEGLRPGMSAEVSFQLDSKRDVVRIPLRAVRWLDGNAYAAIPGKKQPQWRKLQVGQLNPTYAEVRSGLAPGDRVIAEPELLPAPTSGRIDSLARSTDDYRG